MIYIPAFFSPQPKDPKSVNTSGETTSVSDKAKESAALLNKDIQANTDIIYLSLLQNKEVRTAADKCEKLPKIRVKIRNDGMYTISLLENTGNYAGLMRAFDNANFRFSSDSGQEQKFDLNLDLFSQAKRIDTFQAREEANKRVIAVINEQINLNPGLTSVEAVQAHLTVSPSGFITISKLTGASGETLPDSFTELIKGQMKYLRLPCLEEGKPLKLELTASITRKLVSPLPKPQIKKIIPAYSREEMNKKWNLDELRRYILYTPRLRKLAEQCGRGTKVIITIHPKLDGQDAPSYSVEISGVSKKLQSLFGQKLVDRKMDFKGNSEDIQIELTLPERIFTDKAKREKIKKQNIMEAQKALRDPKLMELAQSLHPGATITFTIGANGGYSSTLNKNGNSTEFIRYLSTKTLPFTPPPNQVEQVITLPLSRNRSMPKRSPFPAGEKQLRPAIEKLLGWIPSDKTRKNLNGALVFITCKKTNGSYETKVDRQKSRLFLGNTSLNGNQGTTGFFDLLDEVLQEENPVTIPGSLRGENTIFEIGLAIPKQEQKEQWIGTPMTEKQIREKGGELMDLRLRILNTPEFKEGEINNLELPKA